MKKVFLFTDSLGAGGAQRQLVGLSILLKQKGYETGVVLYHDVPFYKSILDEFKITSVVVPRANRRLGRVSSIVKFLKKRDPDCLIAYQEIPSFIACVSRLMGCHFRIIVSERNTTQTVSFFDKIRFRFLHFADWVVPNSITQSLFLAQYDTSLAPKLVTITNYIDTDYFSPPKEISSKGVLIILCVGRLSEQKNVLRFFEAVSLVKKRYSRFIVKWVGGIRDKDYYDKCRMAINSLKIDDYVEIFEETKDIKPFYNEANIFCLPSLWEGFPNTLCEAMSCGLPIACSNVCDNPMIIGENNKPYIFDPRDVYDMADKLFLLLLMKDETRKEIGTFNREIAVSSFSKSVFIDNYIKLIENDTQ